MKIYNWLLAILACASIIIFALTNRYEYIQYTYGNIETAYTIRVDHLNLEPACIVPFGGLVSSNLKGYSSVYDIKEKMGADSDVPFCMDLLD